MWIEELPNGKYKFVERYTDPMTGKVKKVSMTHSKKTKKVQEEMLIQLRNKIDDLTIFKNHDNNYTFKKVCDEYLAFYKDTVKESTYIRTKSRLNSLCKSIGGVLYSDLIPAHFNRYFNDILSTNKSKYVTARQTAGVVKRVIDFAFLNLNLDKTKLKPLIIVPKKNMSKDNSWKFLDHDELKQVLEFLKTEDEEYFNIAFIMVNCGMRYGELVSINYENDINFEENYFSINKTYNVNTQSFTSTKTGKPRLVYFNEEVKNIIRKQINISKLKNVKYGLNRDLKLLFMSNRGNPLLINFFNRKLKEVPGIDKKLTSHIFRHTFISLSIEAGVPKDLIINQVGHANSYMIDEVYSHFTKAMEEQQKEAFTELVITP